MVIEKTSAPRSSSQRGVTVAKEIELDDKVREHGRTDGARGCEQVTAMPTAIDAQEGEYGDLVSKGIIDPTKVVRTALQDAASIAGLLMTTEAMVAEKPKKESPMPAMPPGGGMDY